MRHGAKIGVAAIAVVVLAGCEATQNELRVIGGVGGAVLGGIVGNQFGSGSGRFLTTIAGAGIGAWLGTKFADVLNEKDQESLAQSTQQTALSGQTISWNNPATGVSGVTKVKQTTRQATRSQVRVLKDRVKETPPLDFVNQIFEAKTNANVRGGPSEDYLIVDSLTAGDQLVVLGKVTGKEWFLISENGIGAGYVFASLLKQVADEPVNIKSEPPPPADDVVEVTIASGQTCRIITQQVVLSDGTEQEDEVTVCNGPGGWQIV